MLEYANRNQTTLDKIKADLAKKAMEGKAGGQQAPEVPAAAEKTRTGCAAMSYCAMIGGSLPRGSWACAIPILSRTFCTASASGTPAASAIAASSAATAR